MTIQEFYAADPRRERSMEVDFGVDWVEREGDRWPRWRVSWVEATGELYALRLDRSDRVVPIGVADTRRDVERAMDGWEDEFGRPLAWAQARFGSH